MGQAKPGDTILITNPLCEGYSVDNNHYRVRKCPYGPQYDQEVVWFNIGAKPCWVKQKDCCVVICSPMGQAKPGDIIEVTSEICKGKQYKIVEQPSNASDKDPDLIWCVNLKHQKKNTPRFFCPDTTYRIIEHETTVDVDERLRKQTDDNLRSVFV